MCDDAGPFPAKRRGSAFVALKGSWNRSEPTGDTVVRVPFQDGKPAGDYENFMTGFWAAGAAGRCVGAAGRARRRYGRVAPRRR